MTYYCCSASKLGPNLLSSLLNRLLPLLTWWCLPSSSLTGRRGVDKRAVILSWFINCLSCLCTLKCVLLSKLSNWAAKPLFFLPNSAPRWQKKKKFFCHLTQTTAQNNIVLWTNATQPPHHLTELCVSKAFLLLNSKYFGLAKISDSESLSFVISCFTHTYRNPHGFSYGGRHGHTCAGHMATVSCIHMTYYGCQSQNTFLLEKTNSGLKLMEKWCYADGWLNSKEKRKKNSEYSTFLSSCKLIVLQPSASNAVYFSSPAEEKGSWKWSDI